MTQDQRVDSAARMLAAAYWRGRLESIRVTVSEQSTIEAMVKAAAEADKDHWKASAKIAVATS
jgi:hypothetical protein